MVRLEHYKRKVRGKTEVNLPDGLISGLGPERVMLQYLNTRKQRSSGLVV